jgi:hypothetical protein
MKNPIILFYKDWAYYPSARPDINTRNKSALKFASILKTMGIKNHHFHLALINPALSGVDPFDPDLTNETKLLIVNECKINPWYFFRECLRIPIEGGIGSKFLEFNRANISLFWCFFNHIRYFLIQPRQTGKSVSADSTYVYLLLLGGLNTKISLLTKDDDLRRRNILRMKKIMDVLPRYIDIRNKNDSNNQECITVNALQNRFDVFVPQKDEKGANNVGRGITTPVFGNDEGPFISWIEKSLQAALPGMSAAIEDAKSIGAHYGSIFTTTAGSKDDKSGAFIYNAIQASYVWNEDLYDSYDEEELYKIVKMGGKNTLSINGTFSYKQLGKDDPWMMDQLQLTMQTPDAANKDYFNVWRSGTESHPLPLNLRNVIVSSQKEAVYTEIDRENYYTVRWYIRREDINQRLYRGNYILGVDPSEGCGRDDIGVVLTDVSTGETIAAANINETNILTFGEWIHNVLVKYPSITLLMERRNTGASILDHLLRSLPAVGVDPFKRIFNTIVNNYDEEEKAWKEINVSMSSRPRNIYVKYKSKFGFATSGAGMFSRSNLYDYVLFNAAKFIGNVTRDKILIDQINTLTKIKNRVDHEEGKHDDLVIAWLMNMWLMTTGKNLSYYGINTQYLLMSAKDITQKEYSTKQKHDKIAQVKLNKEIDEVTDMIKDEKDPYISKQLENKLRALCSRVTDVSDTKITFEDLIGEIEKKKNSNISLLRKNILQRNRHNGINNDYYYG